MNPRPGEAWFFDLGYRAKPRWAMVLTNPPDKRLALATVVLITTQFDRTPYELALPPCRGSQNKATSTRSHCSQRSFTN